MKKHSSTIILILVFVVGLSLLLYPTVANWWNKRHASVAIGSYTSSVASAENKVLDDLWLNAQVYNSEIAKVGNSFSWRSEEQMAEYNRQMSIDGSTMMGVLEIPKLDVSLPIYHGTEENVLSSGIGHLEGTSLPVGGASTHAVLSGHRGLPSARLLTDLDKMNLEDLFYMEIFGETLAYEVDQILIILPEDVSALKIIPGEDLCTLITCTPYGINSHRLLVRGHRVDAESEEIHYRVVADAIQMEPRIIAPFVAAPILLVLLVGVFVVPQKKKYD